VGGMSLHDPAHPNTQSRERWFARYERIAVITVNLGRLPRLSDGVRPADVSWVANQRRATTLSAEQKAALRALPGWSARPRDERWLDRAEELRTFIHTHKRAPRVRGAIPGETALAHWSSRQRVKMRDGTLSRARTNAYRYATRSLP
jgi:hypothetical protein